METEIVIGQAVEIHNTSEKPIEYNITTYTIDVTDLRYVQSVKSIYSTWTEVLDRWRFFEAKLP